MTPPEEPDEIERFARMVANSSAFQEEVKRYTEEEANSRVHRVMAEKADDLPRPFAVIEIGDWNSRRTAGGIRNTFAIDGDLIWWLASEMSNPEDPKQSIKDFWSWAKRVFADVHELAGFDDNANVIGMTIEQKVAMSHEFGGDITPWVWCSWRVELGTF